MSDYHVVPIDDLMPHDDTDGCWCLPRVEHVCDGRLITHHSADGRETFEAEADALNTPVRWDS